MKAKLLSATLISILLLSSIVLAIPGIPHAFRGSVTINGQPAPDGTVVTAKIAGDEVERGTTTGGKYGYPWGTFYIADPYSIRRGKTINFFVNDIDTGTTAVFVNEAFTELDLAITTGGGTPPAGGGGGGGVYIPPETEEETEETETQGETTVGCQENWVCGDWSACVNGIQTRICVDENNCGTKNNEPFLSQPCTVEEATEQGGDILGFFLLSPTDIVVASVVGILIALVIIFLVKRRKK